MRSLNIVNLFFSGCKMQDLAQGEVGACIANGNYHLTLDLSNCNLNKNTVFDIVKKSPLYNFNNGCLSIKLKEYY